MVSRHDWKDYRFKNPTTFTEKLQWYKLYYDNDLIKKCVDKYSFKTYIADVLGSNDMIAPLITVWNSPVEVDIESIEYNKFVIKSNLQSDGKFIYIVYDKNRLDIKQMEEDIKKNWFDKKQLLTNSYCSAYYGVQPRVIVEEFIEQFEGASNDYKIFCFSGVPKYIYVAEDHFKNGINTDSYPITFFDLNWSFIDVSYGNHSRNENVVPPIHLSEMIEVATKLSRGFPFVRVDFFDTCEKLFISEMTFYPGGGMTPYYPESFDKLMGDMFVLPKNKVV